MFAGAIVGVPYLGAAVAIAALVLFGSLFGVMGVLVATPLTVTIMVVVKMVYVEDTLGDPPRDL